MVDVGQDVDVAGDILAPVWLSHLISSAGRAMGYGVSRGRRGG